MKRSEEMLELPAQEEEVFGAARLTARREGFAPPEQSCLTLEAVAVAAGVVGAATVDCESSVKADSLVPLVLVLIPDGAPPMTVYDGGDADHQSQQVSFQH